jgi:hypothetical protein
MADLRELLLTSLKAQVTDGWLTYFVNLPTVGDYICQKLSGDKSRHFPTPSEVSDYWIPRELPTEGRRLGRVRGQPRPTDHAVTYILKKVLCVLKSVGVGVIRVAWSPISAVFNDKTTLIGLGNLVYRFCRMFTGDWSLVHDIYEKAREYFTEQPVEFCTEILLNLAFVLLPAGQAFGFETQFVRLSADTAALR